jgi:hypothetical protein
MKKFLRQQNGLVVLTILLLVAAIFNSIYEDGLGVLIIAIFPYSFLILIILVVTSIRGFKNRDKLGPWYVHSLVILLLSLSILWTPVLENSRNFTERNWRWNSRNQVVADIKSGILKQNNSLGSIKKDQFEYNIAVPFDKYGRVSFLKMRENDNIVEVKKTPKYGYMVTFTTNNVFFSGKEQLIYVEKVDEIDVNFFDSRFNEHWFSYTKQVSIF